MGRCELVGKARQLARELGLPEKGVGCFQGCTIESCILGRIPPLEDMAKTPEDFEQEREVWELQLSSWGQGQLDAFFLRLQKYASIHNFPSISEKA